MGTSLNGAILARHVRNMVVLGRKGTVVAGAGDTHGGGP